MEFGNDQAFFVASTPTSLRAGFPVGTRTTLEPRTTLNFVTGEGATVMTFGLTPAILYQLSGDQARGTYLAVLPGLSYIDADVDSDTQFSLGGGVGVRIPQGEQLGLRLEAQFVHSFESDAFLDSNAIRGLVGFSFWTQ